MKAQNLSSWDFLLDIFCQPFQKTTCTWRINLAGDTCGHDGSPELRRIQYLRKQLFDIIIRSYGRNALHSLGSTRRVLQPEGIIQKNNPSMFFERGGRQARRSRERVGVPLSSPPSDAASNLETVSTCRFQVRLLWYTCPSTRLEETG